jgi:hypothetical protein
VNPCRCLGKARVYDRLMRLAFIGVCCFVAVGCGGGGNQCVPGASVSCTCADNSTGAQVCEDDGTFGPCSCDTEPDAAVETNTRTFHFTGHLTQIDDQAAATGWAVDDTFSGSYTFDLLTADTNTGDATVGDYNFSMTGDGLTVTVGTTTINTDPAAISGGYFIEIVNRDPTSSGDNYLVDTRNMETTGSWEPLIVRWQLDDADGTALSADALPDTAPVLTDWTQGSGFTWEGCSVPQADPTDCELNQDVFVRGVVDTVGP